MEKAVIKETQEVDGGCVLPVLRGIPMQKPRFERKFFVTDLSTAEIEAIVKMHPVVFSEVYSSRWINNIYCDRFDLRNYHENVIGSQTRLKVRVRWYGELFGLKEKPVLELKIKSGLAGWKCAFDLDPFDLNPGDGGEVITQRLASTDTPPALRDLLRSMEPSLINRYCRKYFLSSDGRYRLTVDHGMEFGEIHKRHNTFLRRTVDRRATVVELKYAPEDDIAAGDVTDSLPFRVTKSSKYVSGIDSLSFW